MFASTLGARCWARGCDHCRHRPHPHEEWGLGVGNDPGNAHMGCTCSYILKELPTLKPPLAAAPLLKTPEKVGCSLLSFLPLISVGFSPHCCSLFKFTGHLWFPKLCCSLFHQGFSDAYSSSTSPAAPALPPAPRHKCGSTSGLQLGPFLFSVSPSFHVIAPVTSNTSMNRWLQNVISSPDSCPELQTYTTNYTCAPCDRHLHMSKRSFRFTLAHKSVLPCLSPPGKQ